MKSSWNEGITSAPNAEARFFPLDQQLGLSAKHWSEGIEKLTVWLSGSLPYEQVQVVLDRVGQIHVSRNSAWREANRFGAAFQQVEQEEQKQAQTIRMRGGAVAGETGGNERLGASLDGFMVHIRGEGWKEVKAGCIFAVGKKQKRDESTQEEIETGRAENKSYVAYLGGPEVFGEKLWAEARRRHWTTAEDTQVVADGAVWIWNLVADHFYDSVQVVDWYHAKSHLSQAANLLYGEGSNKAQRWLNEQAMHLFQGDAEDIARTIRKAASKNAAVAGGLQTEAGYFETNKRRMGYLDRRMEGWVIGSGVIESGAKQYQARFKGPGMQWSRAGAERMLPLRSAILGDRFDDLWLLVRKSPKS